MYLSATMTIDPSYLTHQRRKPTKGFRRFAEILTGNLLSQKEEQETFTALSILQEINVVLRSLGVKDVVKLSRDGQIIYDDQEAANSDDIPQAIDTLAHDSGGQPQSQSDNFRELSLLLEHHLATIALVIEIKILRVHDVGIYPIQILINGLDTQLQAAGASQKLDEQLNQIFSDQKSYDAYTESKRTEFAEFIEQLEQAFRNRMRIDNLHRRIHTNIVHPGLTAPQPAGNSNTTADSVGADDAAPMLQRYHSDSSSLMYLWMWSSMMHSNNTYCHSATIVNDQGVPQFNVGDEGFHAGEGSTLNPEMPFELPECPLTPVSTVSGEVSVGSDFSTLLGGDGTDSSSWLDSFSLESDGGGSDGASCSGGSCSGSSCGGGGCGGGCSS
jgi:hypothetical protein